MVAEVLSGRRAVEQALSFGQRWIGSGCFQIWKKFEAASWPAYRRARAPGFAFAQISMVSGQNQKWNFG